MMLRSLFYCVIAGLIISLVGCDTMTPAYVKRRERDYLHSCQYPPLQIPPGLSCANIGDDYIIPPLNCPELTEAVDITPPGLYG